MSLNRNMFHTENLSFLQNSFGERFIHDAADVTMKRILRCYARMYMRFVNTGLRKSKADI